MFRPVGSLIKDISARPRPSPAIFALQVRQAAKEALKTVCSDLPAEIVSRIKPATFKNRTLILKVDSPLVSSELQLRSHGLIEAINRALGAKAVKALRFRVN